MYSAQQSVVDHTYANGYNSVYVDGVIDRIISILSDEEARGRFRNVYNNLTFEFNQDHFAGVGDRGDWEEISRRCREAGWVAAVVYTHRWTMLIYPQPDGTKIPLQSDDDKPRTFAGWWKRLIGGPR